MKTSRLVILSVALLAALAVSGWAQETTFMQVPVQGSYWEKGIGEYVSYTGEIRIVWAKGVTFAFLIADARCEDCGRQFTLYGMPAAELPSVQAVTQLPRVFSVQLIGIGHDPVYASVAEIDLAAARAGGPLIAAR